MRSLLRSFVFLIISRTALAGGYPICRTVDAQAADPDGRQSRNHYLPGPGNKYLNDYDLALAVLDDARRLRSSIVRHLKPMHSGGKLLDWGCGTGRIGLAAREKYPDTDLYGVEFSPEMAEQAIHNGYKRENVISGNVEGDLKADHWRKHFQNNSFDNITMNMVAYMIPDQELQQLFHHAHALLKDEGRFVMTILGEGEDVATVLSRFRTQWGAAPEIDPAMLERLMSANTDLVGKARRHQIGVIAEMAERAGLTFHEELVENHYGTFSKLLVFEKKPHKTKKETFADLSK